MIPKLVRWAAVLAVTLALAACGSSGASNDSGQVDPDSTVHIGFTLEPTGLDITTTSGAALRQLELGNVYEGLVRRNHDGTLEPLLAKEWTISDDKLTYTFSLQEGVTFSNGDAMTAQHVVDSLARFCGEACGGSKETANQRLAAVKSITAEGDNTVVITLTRSDWRLIDTLSTDIGLVVPTDGKVDLANTTNGTGPYEVTNWSQGSSITLTRRDDYWGTKPKNKTVVYHYYTDASAAANALSSGEIDLHTTPSAEARTRFANDDNFTVVEGNSGSWMTLGFNNKAAPLDDARVRRALRMGIDKQGLIEVLGIAAEQVGSMSVPDDKWYTDLTGVDPYNPEEARKLLAEAGQPNLSLTLEVANTYDSKISEYIAAQLKEIGVEVTIAPMEFATWLDKVYSKKDYEMTIVLHVDPWTLTYYGNPAYYWNYDSAAAQKLYTDAMAAPEVEQGHDLLKQLSELVAKDAASDWLYAPKAVVIANTKVTGFPANRINSEFHVWDIEKTA